MLGQGTTNEGILRSGNSIINLHFNEFLLGVLCLVSKASTSVAMTTLFDLYHRGPVKIALLGELLSSVTVGVAGVTSLWGLNQVRNHVRISP